METLLPSGTPVKVTDRRASARPLVSYAPAPSAVAPPAYRPLPAPRAATARRGEMPPLDRILDMIRDGWFRPYLATPEVVLDLATLWGLHTHYRFPTEEGGQGKLAFKVSGRLFWVAPGSGYGKTTGMAMTGEVSANYFGLDQEPTEYGIIDAIADEHATVCIDEGDILFGAGSRKSGVRSVLQAYTHEATKKTGRNGGTRKTMFGPITLSAIDTLATTTGDRFDSMFDRAFVVHMEKAEPLEDPDTRPEEGAEVARKALKYVADQTFEQVLARATAVDLPVPSSVRLRGKQISRPLIAIGEAVGGDWLLRAQRVAEYFRGTGAATAQQQEKLGQDLARVLGGTL